MSRLDRFIRRAFADQVVVVTGAASGIGARLAVRLLEAGARVVLVDRDAVGLTGLQLPSGPAERVVADVTDEAAVQRAIERAVERFGRIDVLINNAGVGVGGEVRDHGISDWARCLDVNLWGVIYGVRAAYPIMIEQGAGHIVNVASVAGLVPLPGEAAYCASKYAVVGLTRTLRTEAAGLGVDVTLVCPGKIETPIYATSPIRGYDKDKVLALWPKGITPDACALIMLRGIARRRGTVVITRFARALNVINRVSPRLWDALAGQYMRTMRAFRVPEPEPGVSADRASATGGLR